MKNKGLLWLLGFVLWSCTTDMEEPQPIIQQQDVLQQRSYSKEHLPFETQQINKLLELANQKNIETQNKDNMSSFVIPNTLSLGEEVVENKRGNHITYSIGLNQMYWLENEFKNLVIQKNGTQEAIYLVTYYPSKAYTQLYKQGYIDTPFEGDYKVEMLSYFDEELFKKAGDSSYTICIPIRIHKRCTAGGNHTPEQENSCRAKGTEAGPKTIESMSCYTFYNRDRGAILSKPVEEKDKVHKSSNGFVGSTSSGGSAPSQNNTTPADNGIPKYECMNADCSKIRPINPMEVTPILATPDDDTIIDKLTNLCAKNILAQMRESTLELSSSTHNFSQMIIDLFENSSKTHLVFEEGTPPDNANASTKGITITLSNNYLNTATQLAIARTMIHEMIHAYLNAIRGNKDNFKNQNFHTILNNYFNSNKDKYKNDPNLLNRLHHEFMGQYVEAMAISLQQWDMKYGTKIDLGFDYYKALSYAGLFQMDEYGNIVSETDTFKELVPDTKKKKDIAKKILNEQFNKKNAKGSRCN